MHSYRLKALKVVFTTCMLTAPLIAASNPVSPAITAYYANYDVYYNNSCNPTANPGASAALAGHAIAQPGYPISGAAANAIPVSSSCVSQNPNPNSKSNADLIDKLRSINGLAYSFLGVNDLGVLFFNDPWSDLSQGDIKLCQKDSRVCGNFKQPPGDWNNYLHYGNFSAAAKLTKEHNKNLSISIGGWVTGVNYYQVFSTQNNINNFVNSLAEIKEQFPALSAIDFDIENNFPADTGGKDFKAFFTSGMFSRIVSAIKHNPRTSQVQVELTVQANPAYINEFIGPALEKDGLADSLQYVNLMSYDFAGAFSKKTGFNSNLHSSPYSDFSVQGTVADLIKYITSTKIKIGVPAYGRAALAGINPENHGLGQPIPSGTHILPGDMDTIGTELANTSKSQMNKNSRVNQDVSSTCYARTGGDVPHSNQTCSGAFTYRYIMNIMLNHGFTATNDPNAVATTAFAENFAVMPALSFNGATVQGVQKDYPDNGAHKNVYISYLSAENSCQYGKFAAQYHLAGGILWEVLGDLPPSDAHSLMNAFNWGFAGRDCSSIEPLAPAPKSVTLTIDYGVPDVWIAGYKVDYQNGASSYVSVQGTTSTSAVLSDKQLTEQPIKDIVVDYGKGSTATCYSKTALSPLSSDGTANLDIAYWGKCNGFTLAH